MKIFKDVCNETTQNPKSGATYTISAICDEDGTFEVQIFGNGGADNAKAAVQRSLELISEEEKSTGNRSTGY